MSFHRNDSHSKVVDYCKEAGIHFEYTDFWDKDEETFRNAKNITALKKRFKQKITTMGGKGKNSGLTNWKRKRQRREMKMLED